MIRRLARRLLGEPTPTPPSHSLGALIGRDGCPLGVPEDAARALLDFANSNEAAPSREDAAALIAATHALTRIAGELGWLPGAEDTSASQADQALHRLRLELQRRGLPSPAVVQASPDWSAWAWRDSDAAVAHARLHGAPSRVWVTSQGLSWDWAQAPLVQVGLGRDVRLHRARVDAPRFLTVQRCSDFSRTVEARKARVIIREQSESPSRIDWQLGPGWAPTRTESGAEADLGDRHLVIQLDPAWRWRIEGPKLSGEGEGPMRCSFELR